MCEGASLDEVLFGIHHKVTTRGWALQAVGGDPPDGADWVYTIGLSGFDHPELLVVGEGVVKVAGVVLNDLGERIRAGDRFDVGDEVPFPSGPVTFGLVHSAHIARGLVAMWPNYYGRVGGELPPVEFLQVVLPDIECSCGRVHGTPLLSDPSVRVGRASRRQPMDRLPSYRPRSAAVRRRRKR